MVRVHRVEHHPAFFSPGDGNPPAGRFDSPGGAFGVLYAAGSLEGAFAETVLRNPQRRLVDVSELATRAVSVLSISRAVRLAEMRGEGLQVLGTDNAVSTGPYAASGAWADVLHAHRDKPDGIAYASRHDPDQLCIALFSTSDVELDIRSGPIPLTDMIENVSRILRRYGKGLA